MKRQLMALGLALAIGFPAAFAEVSVMNTTKGLRLTILPVMGATREEKPAPTGRVRVAPVAVNKAVSGRQVAHGAKRSKTRQVSAPRKPPKPNVRNKG
ncbi:exported protein of unknown function [Methylacidimicrobium sp. AP8]|uniref:hypothetical protein n=1 Tax=Methylacidimicrobium sp. AP8 TaxID=2730359 RepID=UPI0018BFC4D9|nr:hypothetical protein [Methylacidimicrobium sp. AP8]CAB4243026.1 exported protein of unknown function [Methylacidimicrobium sp. AP8]